MGKSSFNMGAPKWGLKAKPCKDKKVGNSKWAELEEEERAWKKAP